MAVVIVCVVVLALGGLLTAGLRARSRARADEAGLGVNELLASPPTSFPTYQPPLGLPASPVPDTEPVSPVAAETPEDDEAETPDAADALVAGEAAGVGDGDVDAARADHDPDAEDGAEDDDDESVIARFRLPGSRSTLPADTPVVAATAAAYPLETPDTPDTDDPIDAAAVSTVEAAMAEPEVALLDDAHEDGTDPDDADEAPLIIDLDHPPEPVGADAEREWQELTFEPEPDSVDHVLQALINRARFKQVGVEEVATELVERADLRGEEVSDVLADLVGRADAPVLDADRSSELVLFNDAVPSRPGQLTDFAKLNAGRQEADHHPGAVPARRPLRGSAAAPAGRQREPVDLVAAGPGGVAGGRVGRRSRRRPAEPPGQVGLTSGLNDEVSPPAARRPARRRRRPDRRARARAVAGARRRRGGRAG